MDSNSFGPMTSADTLANDDLDSLRQKLEYMQNREKQLSDEKKQAEDDFGQKRARFMQLFQQKEEELKQARDATEAAEKAKSQSEEKLSRLEIEVEDIKTAAAISESSKEDDIEGLSKHFEEEVASMRVLMTDAVNQAKAETANAYEKDRIKLIQANEKLEEELQEMKNKLSQEREGFLASVAKTLQKKVHAAGLNVGSSDPESLEDSMKKAQEDVEILRSIVTPLEEEIGILKDKLRSTDAKLQVYEAQANQAASALGQPLASGESKGQANRPASLDLDEKVKELNHHLETEKSSRTDLEMYVAVLNTQKTVMSEENDQLRLEIKELCKMLEIEKHEQDELKRTWQMANDQFLESQALMMSDLRQMEGVLTAEQQRQIAELKKKDAERQAQEKRLQEMEEVRKQQFQKQKDKQASQHSLEDKSITEDISLMSKGSLTSLNSEDLLKFDDEASGKNGVDAAKAGAKRKRSNSLTTTDNKRDFQDSGVYETRSLQDADGALSRTSPDRTFKLTEAQQKAITDPQPESKASQILLASIKNRTDTAVSMVGKRLVSEKEWEKLQQEVKAAREKLGRPCDMCNNYEAQLQTVQEESKKVISQVRMLERQLDMERQAVSSQKNYTETLEDKLKGVSQGVQQQVSTLSAQVDKSEKFFTGMKENFWQSHEELKNELKRVSERREEIDKELKQLQADNESLMGIHSKHSQEMQEECIDLPNNLDEMQLLLLKYREEIIAAKVAKEYTEGSLHSEIMFLKDQVVGEQQEKATLDETLGEEIRQLQEELAVLRSCKSELDRQKSVQQETNTKLKETEQTLGSHQAKSKQLIHSLQKQVEEQTQTKAKLENDVLQLRSKVQTLQVDLENSEAVQRDFVKLSQSLQIQLEKIRAAEHEVRWQHEEDVDECNNCRQQFTVTRRKHHCRHCGRIFCSDCLPKTVNSGPALRPTKVCDVCHTILVPDAMPYFSTEPPNTPD